MKTEVLEKHDHQTIKHEYANLGLIVITLMNLVASLLCFGMLAYNAKNIMTSELHSRELKQFECLKLHNAKDNSREIELLKNRVCRDVF